MPEYETGTILSITTEALALSSLVVLTAVSLFLYFLVGRLWNRRPKLFPPGPPSVPILGSVPFLKYPSAEFFKEFMRLGETYGGLFSLALGNTWVVVLNDFQTIKEALVGKSIEFAGRIDDPRERHIRQFWPIKGILTSSYSTEWKNQRTYIMYLLRHHGWGKKSMENRIGEERDALLKAIEKTGGQNFDPSELVNISVANVICSLLYGQRFKHGDQELKRIVHIINWFCDFFAESAERDYIPLLQLSPSYIKMYLTFKRLNEELVTILQAKIQERRDRMVSDPSDTPRDFIESYLMGLANREQESYCPITEDWLFDIVTDVLCAGAETTATTLRWAILYMAKYPEIQARIQEELDGVLGEPMSCGQEVLAHKHRLPYTDATMAEIQRISAIVPLAIVHCTTKDVDFRGYHLPKDTQVRVNLYAAMHDPKVWPEPMAFKPERFLDSEGQRHKPEEWIPFSMGRRMCLGEQLAKQELFIVFTGILHSFKILVPEGEPPPDDAHGGGVVLKSKPYKVRFVPRFAREE